MSAVDIDLKLDAKVMPSLRSAQAALSGPMYVGHFDITEGEIKVHQKVKPSLWFRFWVRVFFNVRWIDEK